MKIESLRDVKNNLSSVIEGLGASGPVVITKHGKSRAILLAVDETTDLESLLLSTSPRFWRLFDEAGQVKKWVALEEL